MQFVMNRTGDTTLWTSAEYEAQGAVPQVFTKSKVIGFKPNLVQALMQVPASYIIPPSAAGSASANTVALGTTPKYDIWLATNQFNVEIDTGSQNYGLTVQNLNTPRYQGLSPTLLHNAPARYYMYQRIHGL